MAGGNRGKQLEITKQRGIHGKAVEFSQQAWNSACIMEFGVFLTPFRRPRRFPTRHRARARRVAARGAPPPPQAREGGRENARGARRDGRHPKRRPRASQERAESPRRAESRRAACVARPRARGAPLARLAADAAPARGGGGGSLHRAERKEGRTTDENRTIRTPSRAACLLGCGGESRQTVRFETRSRARVRAGARPAVRNARSGGKVLSRRSGRVWRVRGWSRGRSSACASRRVHILRDATKGRTSSRAGQRFPARPHDRAARA